MTLSRLLLTRSAVAAVWTIFLENDMQYFNPWSSALTQSITYVEETWLNPSHCAGTLLLTSSARARSSWLYERKDTRMYIGASLYNNLLNHRGFLSNYETDLPFRLISCYPINLGRRISNYFAMQFDTTPEWTRECDHVTSASVCALKLLLYQSIYIYPTATSTESGGYCKILVHVVVRPF